MSSPYLTQQNFRVGDSDGFEGAHGWLGTLGQDLNMGPSQTITDGKVFFLRFTYGNSGSKNATIQPQIEMALNGGSYSNIGSTGVIKTSSSIWVADGDATTDRLGGTGTFDTTNAGVIEGTSLGASETLANGYRMEVLIVLEFDQTGLTDSNNGDYYDIRIAGADAWTDIPRLTIANIPSPSTPLTVLDAGHSHTADGVTFTQVHSYAVAEATHGHIADGATFTQVHSFSVAEATHGQAADNVTLTHNHILGIAEATHSHIADGVTFTQVHQLAINEATHGHTADGVTFTQVHQLAINEATHGHTADNVTVSEAAATPLTIHDATHGHTADGVTFIQEHVFIVADATHGHTADNITLTHIHQLAINDATHGHTADGVTFIQVHQLAINEALHDNRTDMVRFQSGTSEKKKKMFKKGIIIY